MDVNVWLSKISSFNPGVALWWINMAWVDTPPYNQNNTTQSHGYVIHGKQEEIIAISLRTLWLTLLSLNVIPFHFLFSHIFPAVKYTRACADYVFHRHLRLAVSSLDSPLMFAIHECVWHNTFHHLYRRSNTISL